MNYSYLPFAPVPSLPPYFSAGITTLVYNDANIDEYNKYIELLKGDGFECHNCFELRGNNFCTLFKGSLMLHVYYCESERTVRTVSHENAAAPVNRVPLEGSAALYQFETNHVLIDCGMCYIIQCCDGSFFVIDSSHYYSFNDNDRIHRLLRERTPQGQKIIINGWYFSHAHTDHVSQFMNFLRFNCDDVIIEGIYYNFVDNTHPDSRFWGAEEKHMSEDFRALVDSRKDIPKYIVHTGQHFYLRNLELTVLYTHEDAYPNSLEDYNTSSSVLSVKVSGTHILFPGDASGIAGDILIRRYGDELKCDILQAAHHGHFGLSVEFYKLANASAILFPTTQIKYDEEYVVFEANRVAADLSTECHISSNGTVKFPLPYVAGNTEFVSDETFEDFDKINCLWGYEYTDERKKELYDAFVKRGGKRITVI